MPMHKNGPGLRIVGDPTRQWFGGGYCCICGQTSTKVQHSPLIGVAVRYWDPDDGWRRGVLCLGCGEEAAARGPQKGDYAYKDEEEQREKADVEADALKGDEDGWVATD